MIYYSNYKCVIEKLFALKFQLLLILSRGAINFNFSNLRHIFQNKINEKCELKCELFYATKKFDMSSFLGAFMSLQITPNGCGKYDFLLMNATNDK